MNRRESMTIALSIAGLACAAASANVNVTQGDSAPTYSTTLNFDEPGGPVGAGLASDSWLLSHGVTTMQAGDAFNRVENRSAMPGFGWLPDSNAFVGGFGVFMEFENDLTEFSAQIWDNAGPGGPFSGGMIIVALDDGVEVLNEFFDNPVYGVSGDADTWFDITTTDGMVFDEVRIVGFAFVGPETIVDNISWNAVPAPGSMAVLAIGGLAATRRRRA